MRIRTKPWAKPELAACPYFTDDPAALKGHWSEKYPRTQPFHIEIGCGKGGFISQIAPAHPEINYLALDIKREMVAFARRKSEKSYAEAGVAVDNLMLALSNADRIAEFFAPEDKVERIYLTFSNPWPKAGHHKRRLTHPRFLEQYKSFLAPGGEIHFKTDDDDLFDATLGYLEESGFAVLRMTRDLHADMPADNVITEHEAMFTEQGIPIKMLVAAVKTEE